MNRRWIVAVALVHVVGTQAIASPDESKPPTATKNAPTAGSSTARKKAAKPFTPLEMMGAGTGGKGTMRVESSPRFSDEIENAIASAAGVNLAAAAVDLHDDDIEIESEAGLYRQQVVNLLKVKVREAKLKNCYVWALRKNRALKGMVVVRFILGPKSVGNVLIDVNSTGDEDLAKCVTALIAGWDFPTPPEDGVAVTVPLVFSYGR